MNLQGAQRVLMLSVLWITVQTALKPPVAAAPPLTAAVFSKDGSVLLTGSQAGVQVRAWPSLEVISLLDTELEHVHDLKFSPDGHRLLIAGGTPAESGTVEVMDWTDRRVIHRVSSHRDVVYQVAWLHDGVSWVTASGDRTCRVNFVDKVSEPADSRTVIFADHSQPVLSVCPLHDHELIASTGADQTLRIWNGRTGQMIRSLDNHVASVCVVAASLKTGGTELPPVVATVSEDRTVRFWNPVTGRMLRFARLSVVPRAAVWSHTGRQLFVGCDDGSVFAVDPEDARTRLLREPQHGRIFEIVNHPSEPALVTAGESDLRVITTD